MRFDKNDPQPQERRNGMHWAGPGAVNWLGIVGWVAPIGLVLFTLSFMVALLGVGFSNPYTPPGYIGYVTRSAFIVGSDRFEGVQQGPASYGSGWMLGVVNVPSTPRTFEEAFTGNEGILTQDNVRIDFSVGVTMRLRRGADANGKPWAQTFFERYTTLHKGDNPEQIFNTAYKAYLQQQLRGYVRQSGDQHAGLDVQDNMAVMLRDVTNQLETLTKDTPFEIMQVNLYRVHYPSQITEQIEKTQISIQQLEQEKVRVQIARKDAEINDINAQGLADAAQIINSSISACWLKYQALLALEENIKADNETRIMIPVGPNGVPLTNIDANSSCHAADVKAGR